jgi:hypothetical protein
MYSIKEQIRRVLESGSDESRFIMVRSGEVLRFGPQYESVVHFLGAAYGRMISSNRKSVFRKALGDLFADYVLNEERLYITVESPAISLLYLVSEVCAYRQLTKIVRMFNHAELDAEEAGQVLFVLLAILGSTGSNSARKALLQLVDGPNFRAAYAITALQIELNYHPRDFHGSIRKYAPMIHSVCLEVERRGDESEKQQLQDALEELRIQMVNGLHMRLGTHKVFRMYRTKPGRWSVLMERIAASA